MRAPRARRGSPTWRSRRYRSWSSSRASEAIALHGGGPGSAARRGRGRRVPGGRTAGSSARPRPPRGSKARRISPRRSWCATAFRRRHTARSPMPVPRTSTSSGWARPIVVKADGLAAGKGVVVAADARGSARRRRRDAHRQEHGRRRQPGRDRAVPRRRGGELHRDVRRPACAAACEQPGPQAPARRRQRTQHRRHGRLLAGPGGHPGRPRPGAARSDTAGARRHGAGRHALFRAFSMPA